METIKKDFNVILGLPTKEKKASHHHHPVRRFYSSLEGKAPTTQTLRTRTQYTKPRHRGGFRVSTLRPQPPSWTTLHYPRTPV